jgi:hypothetical protein
MIAILPGEAESRLSARVSFWTLKGSIASAPGIPKHFLGSAIGVTRGRLWAR